MNSGNGQPLFALEIMANTEIRMEPSSVASLLPETVGLGAEIMALQLFEIRSLDLCYFYKAKMNIK